MPRVSFVSSAATVIAVALSAQTALATVPAPVDQDNEKQGGNASDNAAPKPAVVARDSLPPRAYEEMAEFWSMFLSSADPFIAGYATGVGDDSQIGPPSLQLTTAPTDGPAESILDSIDDGPILLVGTPGSYYAQPAAASGETATPPPESILDSIDQPGAAQPATGGATTPATANSAVNQAPRPAVVEQAP